MSVSVTSDKKRVVPWIIVLFFIFGFGFFPPVGQMTPIGMRILGIFIGAVYGWTALGILKPTLVAILGFGLTVGFSTFLSTSFGVAMVAMLLLLFPICGMLNKYGVIAVVAQKFVTAKFCEGHPWRLCFMILLGAYVCVNINVLVAAVLFIDFMRNICKIAEIKIPNKWSVTMMMGIALAMMCGQLMIPVHGTPLVLIGALSAITGTTVNMAKYMLLVIPMSLILLAGYICIMKYILHTDVEPLKKVTIESLGGKKSFNADQLKALIILILTIAGLVASVAVPAGSAAHQILSGKLGLFGICMCTVCILLFVKNEAGQPLFDFNECARSGMAWEPFFLVAFIIPFSSFMTGGETGISATLTMLMKPLFALSPLAFLIIMYLCVNIITNFAQNTVVVIIFLPLFMAYGQATGFDMSGYYVLLFLLAQMAISTPGSSTLCGIIYSSVDLVDTKLVVKTAVKVLPIIFILLMLLGLPFTMLLY